MAKQTGGPKGRPQSHNRALTRKLVDKYLSDGGLCPFEYYMQGFRAALAMDPPDHEKALLYADKAAPYMHPKLQAIELGGADDGPIPINVVVDDSTIEKFMRKFNATYRG